MNRLVFLITLATALSAVSRAHAAEDVVCTVSLLIPPVYPANTLVADPQQGPSIIYVSEATHNMRVDFTEKTFDRLVSIEKLQKEAQENYFLYMTFDRDEHGLYVLMSSNREKTISQGVFKNDAPSYTQTVAVSFAENSTGLVTLSCLTKKSVDAGFQLGRSTSAAAANKLPRRVRSPAVVSPELELPTRFTSR